MANSLNPDKGLVIVVQGPLRIQPAIMEEAWKGFPIIWSTWVGTEIESNNTIIHNEEPEYTNQNLGHQQTSTLSGVLRAKELGYKRCLKWRSDQYPNNPEKLVELFDGETVNMLYWHNHNSGYYVDYFMEGDVDDMIKIWDFKDYHQAPYPEFLITKRIQDAGVRVNCIGDYLTEDNDIFWEKEGFFKQLSQYKDDGKFTNNK